MSNELISHILKDIQNDVKEIKIQTTKTNGRVSALENWKGYITGGISVIVIVLVPLIINILKK